MNTISKSGVGAALLALTAGCGSETPSADNQAFANGQTAVENSMIVDPEVPVAVDANGAAAAEPASEAAATNEPAAVKIAPVPPAAPKAAPKAKADAPKPKAPPPAGHDMGNMSGHDMGNMQH